MTPQKTYRLMAYVALAILFLLALAIYSLSRLTSAPWTSFLTTPMIEEGPRKELPSFNASFDGKTLGRENFEEHWTLLSFWSYTCAPCVEEMPALNQLSLGWQGPEFTVLTVNTDKGEELEMAKQFLQEQQISLPTIYDENGVLRAAFAVDQFPRHFLIAPDSRIVWEATGAFRWNETAARDQLLKLMELQTPESDPDSAE